MNQYYLNHIPRPGNKRTIWIRGYEEKVGLVVVHQGPATGRRMSERIVQLVAEDRERLKEMSDGGSDLPPGTVTKEFVIAYETECRDLIANVAIGVVGVRGFAEEDPDGARAFVEYLKGEALSGMMADVIAYQAPTLENADA